jgi:hypothetical protein
MMRKKSLMVVSLVAFLFVLQSCSSKPEQALLKNYFHAISLNDNNTMSTIALEPITIDAQSWEITGVPPEKIEPATLAELNKKELEFKKKLEGHVGPTLDAKDVVDAAKEEEDTARTGGAKAAAKKKVDDLQAKYEQVFNEHKELQRNYNEAKAAADREEEITAFSLGVRSLANIRDLTGDVDSKEVTVRAKEKSGTVKSYKFYLRQYTLKDPASNMNLKGRWVIVKTEVQG